MLNPVKVEIWHASQELYGESIGSRAALLLASLLAGRPTQVVQHDYAAKGRFLAWRPLPRTSYIHRIKPMDDR